MNVNSLKEFSGNRRMYKFAFINFMKENGLTIEAFAKEIGYSTDGVVRMVTRGTIKKALFEGLSHRYKNIERYRSIK
jgi:hypothetical protein